MGNTSGGYESEPPANGGEWWTARVGATSHPPASQSGGTRRRSARQDKGTIYVAGVRIGFEDAISLAQLLQHGGTPDALSAATMIELGVQRKIVAVPLSSAETQAIRDVREAMPEASQSGVAVQRLEDQEQQGASDHSDGEHGGGHGHPGRDQDVRIAHRRFVSAALLLLDPFRR